MPRRPAPRRPTARRHRPTPPDPPAGSAAAADRDQDQDRDRAGAIADLEGLYAALPDLACKGLCGHSRTQHVDNSPAERDRLHLQDPVDPNTPTPTPNRARPALTRTPPAAAPSTPTGP